MSKIPSRIADVIKDILEHANVNYYNVDLRISYPGIEKDLVSEDDKSSIPVVFSYLDIIQDFENNGYDYINTELISLDVENYKRILAHSNELTASLKISIVNPLDVTTDKPKILFSKSFVVLITNDVDVNKELPTKEFDEATSAFNVSRMNAFTLKCQLYDPYIFILHRRRMSGILHNLTMQDMLSYLISAFEITDAYIVPPDNKYVYPNIVIPPTFALNEALRHLQSVNGYGIYNHGLKVYYSNDMIYIYPMYVSKRYSAKHNVHFTFTGNTDLAMEDRYSYKKDKDHFVIVPSTLQSKRKNILTSLTTANQLFIQDLSTVREWCFINESNELQAKGSDELTKLFLNFSNEQGIKMFTPNVYQTHGNEYHVQSEHVKQFGEQIQFQWMLATPFTITPDVQMLIHYPKCIGKDYIVQNTPATCVSVIWSFQRMTMNDKYVYGCTGNISGLIL